MFLHTLKSEGLAHLSYMLGAGGEAAVIDPRRDVDAYLELAEREGVRIAYVFETHRNEDYVIGSVDLARRTGARILHGRDPDEPFRYGEDVREGECFKLGDLRLQVLETPGHTLNSISLVLFDEATGEAPVGVFTGDALFIGDVGRTDFYPGRAREVAGLLYDSLHNKLLPLGDHVILYPAHGAGSVCGSGMADREFSTLGYERRHNPRLQLDRDAFIAFKSQEHHYKPPYFDQMERVNRDGDAPLVELPLPAPLGVDAFAEAQGEGMVVLDVRSPEAIAAAAVPGSLGIPLDMIPAFVGWYVPYDKDIGLVVEEAAQLEPAVRHLVRLGYRRVSAWLRGGMTAWATSGRPYDTIPAVHAQEIKARTEAKADYTLLDVRGVDEVAQGYVPGSTQLYVGELGRRLEEVPDARPITTFCGSGQRAIIAASVLRRAGYQNVEVALGSMAACRAIGCPIIGG
ncbi:MBL fold metallo-hydrolase [Ectothiorhodospiraceae bacterium 2226]|nr:MBL fold metallo-hydrolase [Ectothiorhodospiraceae bacterium 2226]